MFAMYSLLLCIVHVMLMMLLMMKKLISRVSFLLAASCAGWPFRELTSLWLDWSTSCPVVDLSSPWDDYSASWQSTSWECPRVVQLPTRTWLKLCKMYKRNTQIFAILWFLVILVV